MNAKLRILRLAIVLSLLLASPSRLPAAEEGPSTERMGHAPHQQESRSGFRA
jgi:hypothetical protein